MKKLIKMFGSMALILAMVLSVIPAMPVKAGGCAAAIFVKYILVDEYGGYDYLEDEEVQGLSQTIEGAESGETFWWDGYQTYTMFIEPTAGEYTVTDFGVPEGYEFDEYATVKYPLTTTITKQDVADYKAWAESGEEAGTVGYEIKIPLKKKGEKPAYYKKPGAPDIRIYPEDAYFGSSIYFYTQSVDEKLATTTYEVRYSASKKGKLATLKKNYKGNTIRSNELKKIKSGTTIYVRIRAIKTIGKEKIVGAWSKKTKFKVVKGEY